MKNKLVYLDYASTTPTNPEVVKAMLPYFSQKFGNPSNLYFLGRQAFDALEASRKTIGQIFNCSPEEIYFTSGGTESNNLAIRGLARNFPQGHIIISNIEHHATLRTVQDLARQGWEFSQAPASHRGLIEKNAIKAAIQKNTFLISLIWANNEIGTIADVNKISRMVARLNQIRLAQGLNKIYLHLDGCQALPYLPVNLKKLSCHLLTFNGSKIYGPKGIGGLFIRHKTPVQPILTGGDQELGLRAGTQNVPAIVGLAKALELITKNQVRDNARLKKLQSFLISQIRQKFPQIKFNGSLRKRIPSNINISIPGIEGEALTLMLDKFGIQVSTGSACASSDLKPSHVLQALGQKDELAHSSIRITLGKNTTKQDLVYFILSLKQTIQKLKKITAHPNHPTPKVRPSKRSVLINILI